MKIEQALSILRVADRDGTFFSGVTLDAINALAAMAAKVETLEVALAACWQTNGRMMIPALFMPKGWNPMLEEHLAEALKIIEKASHVGELRQQVDALNRQLAGLPAREEEIILDAEIVD